MAIDRVDWHWDNAEKLYRKTHGITCGLTDEQSNEIALFAGNHIGLFLRWIIERGFEGNIADPEHCEMVRSGRMTGAEYLLSDCDGKLWDDDICEDILPFVKSYYDDSNDYYEDYCNCCTNDDDKPLFGVISNDEDYAKLRVKIDEAFEKFKCKKS